MLQGVVFHHKQHIHQEQICLNQTQRMTPKQLIF